VVLPGGRRTFLPDHLALMVRIGLPVGDPRDQLPEDRPALLLVGGGSHRERADEGVEHGADLAAGAGGVAGLGHVQRGLVQCADQHV